MESITEQNIDFENEPEPKRFLSKKQIFELGGIDADLIGIGKEVKVSKKGEQYATYTLFIKLDEYTEYEINNVFRNELSWGKRKNPERIHLTAIRDGEYYNWKISASE